MFISIIAALITKAIVVHLTNYPTRALAGAPVVIAYKLVFRTTRAFELAPSILTVLNRSTFLAARLEINFPVRSRVVRHLVLCRLGKHDVVCILALL